MSDEEAGHAEASRNAAFPKPAGNTASNTKYWVGFGAVFSLMAFILLLVAFFAPENSCDRWTLLRYVLPIFSGIAAGAFAGAIAAQGSIGQIAVAATGGFAVYIISLVAIGVPPRCQTAQISHYMEIDNTDPVGERRIRLPRALTKKRDTYDLTDADNFVMFVGAVIDNVYTIGRNVDLEVEVAGLDANKNKVWREPEHVTSLDSWRSGLIAERFGAEAIERALGVGDTSHEGKFILIWGIECRTVEELAAWTGAIQISVKDNKMGEATQNVKPKEVIEFAQIGARPSKSLPGRIGTCPASS
jgi:hypothetical protein